MSKKYNMSKKRIPSTRVIATERKIKLNGWTCEIGTMNKANPTSSFVKIGGYCNPQDNDINEVMHRFQFKIERHINKITKELIGKHLPKEFNPIKVVEWTDTLVNRQKNKWTYFAIEVTNYHFGISWKDESFKDDLKLILYSIIDYLEDYDEGVYFNNKKRG